MNFELSAKILKTISLFCTTSKCKFLSVFGLAFTLYRAFAFTSNLYAHSRSSQTFAVFYPKTVMHNVIKALFSLKKTIDGFL